MRSWSMRLFLLDEDGAERPADVFTKVVYNLHPTFENPVQSECSVLSLCNGAPADCWHLAAFTKPPFLCSNEGWGEFDIAIDCYTTEKTKLAPILQDLNFQDNKYSSVHDVTFKNPSQALQERLRETGPLPNDEDRPRKKGLAGAGGGKKGAQKFDYEKIAEALQKLEEEDLLKVIQVINENKGPDTYIRSDVEGKSLTLSGGPIFLCPETCFVDGFGGLIVDDLREAGEFSIDLYTMPDALTTKLWDIFVRRPVIPMGQRDADTEQAKKGLVAS